MADNNGHLVTNGRSSPVLVVPSDGFLSVPKKLEAAVAAFDEVGPEEMKEKYGLQYLEEVVLAVLEEAKGQAEKEDAQMEWDDAEEEVKGGVVGELTVRGESEGEDGEAFVPPPCPLPLPPTDSRRALAGASQSLASPRTPRRSRRLAREWEGGGEEEEATQAPARGERAAVALTRLYFAAAVAAQVWLAVVTVNLLTNETPRKGGTSDRPCVDELEARGALEWALVGQFVFLASWLCVGCVRARSPPLALCP